MGDEASRGGRSGELAKRCVFGALYAAIVVACLYFGRIPTAAAVAAMSVLNVRELYRMGRLGGHVPNEWIGIAAAALFPAVACLGRVDWLAIAVLALVLASAVWHVITPRATVDDVALTVLGPLYASLMYSCVVLIRASDAGRTGFLLALGVIGSVWVNDATAYFVGSRFGRHRLCPQISPKKSVEGLWGGLVGSVAVWLVLARLGVPGLGYPFAAVAGIVVGASGVIGDLFESRIKRGAGVKDSGSLIPGHGGMLDRSDSVLFASTVAYVLLRLAGIV